MCLVYLHQQDKDSTCHGHIKTRSISTEMLHLGWCKLLSDKSTNYFRNTSCEAEHAEARQLRFPDAVI